MRRIAIVLAVLVLGTLAAAQQEPGTSTGDTQLVSSNAPAPDAAAARPATAAALPDAPSAAAAEQTSDSASQAGENAPQERVISKRSFFFPEISTSHEPLTVGQKFKQFALNSSSGSALLGSAFSAGINQATNSPSGYGQGGEGYAKRFGSSMATRCDPTPIARPSSCAAAARLRLTFRARLKPPVMEEMSIGALSRLPKKLV